MSSGHVIWLFGLSGAGKSTLAVALRENLLRTMSQRVLMLDGDRLRSGLCRGLGFSDVDRDENLRRAAEVARLGVESDLVVIAAFITPHEKHRKLIRQIIGERHLSLVYLTTSLEVCRTRDTKNLYAGADAGRVAFMTGINSRFDEPSRVDLQLDTGIHGLDICLERLTHSARQWVVRGKLSKLPL